MKITLLTIILIAILSHHISAYSLQGRWNVKSQYLPTNTTASISFEKQLSDDNSRIIYHMNIFACKLIRYKYIVVDNQIYLTFDEYVTQRYDCQINEVNSIRNKLQKVFFFYIVGTQLALYGPSGEAQFQLSRLPNSDPKTLAGQWLTIDVNGVSISESISISTNAFELCDGKGVIEYTVPSLSKPDISFVVKQVSGCSQNQIFSTLYKSQFFRWKSSILLYLYNENFEQIMTIRKIGQKVSSSNTTTSNITVNSQNSSNSKQNQTILPTNQTTILVTNSTSNSTSKNDTNQINQTKNANSTQNLTSTQNVTVSQNITNTTSNQKNDTIQDTTKPVDKSTNNTVTQNTTKTTAQSNETSQQGLANGSHTDIKNNNTTKSISDFTTKTIPQNNQANQTGTVNTNTTNTSITITLPKKYTSISDLPVITQSQFAGKWLIKDNGYEFTKQGYFILVLADKIMLYGGCNVYYSPYSLNKSSLDKINVQNTTKSCPQLLPAIKTLIQNFKIWKYLALIQNNGKLSLQTLDSSLNNLSILQKVV